MPGIAETLDWAAALLSLGARELAPDLVDETLGVVLKYEEDIRQVRGDGDAPVSRRGRRGRLRRPRWERGARPRSTTTTRRTGSTTSRSAGSPRSRTRLLESENSGAARDADGCERHRGGRGRRGGAWAGPRPDCARTSCRSRASCATTSRPTMRRGHGCGAERVLDDSEVADLWAETDEVGGVARRRRRRPRCSTAAPPLTDVSCPAIPPSSARRSAPRSTGGACSARRSGSGGRCGRRISRSTSAPPSTSRVP